MCSSDLLSLALIPRFGLAGAALATLTSAVVMEFGIVLTRTCRHQSVSLLSVLRPILPVVVSLAPMVFAAQWLQSEWAVDSLLVLIVQCLLAGSVYLLSAGLVVIRRDEWRLVMKKLRALRSSKANGPLGTAVGQE